MDQNSASNFGILISVETCYLDKQSDLPNNAHAFSYTINIQNNRSDTVQLIDRHWVITDQNNKVEEVKGKGVIGKQPFIKPGESFQYSSGAIINTNIGDMKGLYTMQTEDGENFEAKIPLFILATPNMLH